MCPLTMKSAAQELSCGCLQRSHRHIFQRDDPSGTKYVYFTPFETERGGRLSVGVNGQE